MPVDHYKMTIQAKPLATLGEKHHHAEDSIILGISRPLGHLRKTKASVNIDIPKPEKSEDSFPHITSIGFYDSDDEMSSKESSISRETGRSRLTSRRGSLTSVGISRQQVFENRYKLAAARSQPDATKPANMYSKRVVYLPMFRVNVETYIGEAEDHKTVENTRQSLRKILDKSRSKMKSPEKIANKLRDYFKQQELDNIKKQEEENEHKLSRKEMLRVNLPKTPFLQDKDVIRIPSVPLDGGHTSKVEALDLTSVTEDDGVSILSTKTNKTKYSGNDVPKIQSERASSPKQCFGPLYGVETERGTQSSQVVTYADIRRMRQKGRLKVVNKTENTNMPLDQQDAKDWISIQSKPVLKYTTPQSTKQKLDPIIVPSHPCSECPMCKAAKYKSTEPTAVPPNSPTLKRGVFDAPGNVHDHIHGDLHVSDHHTVSVNNFNSMEDLQIKGQSNINIIKKGDRAKGLEVKPKRAVQQNLPVSKVTVRIAKYREGLLQDAKLTNSNSNSTGSINEL